jgi:kynurenine formamidase
MKNFRLLSVGTLLCLAASQVPSATHPTVTKGDVDKMFTTLSNWGRWGKDDQLGALNLITPEKRKAAAKLVKEGVPVSLAHNVIKERSDDSPAFEQKMISGFKEGSGGAMDAYSVQYHGFNQTHLDALCHVFYNGKLFNDVSPHEITEHGAGKLSVINMKNGIFTRAVLMDIPRLLGTRYLAGAKAIYTEDLEAWEKKTGVKVGSGDVILIYTGRWARRAAEGQWKIMQGSAGLHVSVMPWLKQRDVAILGSDLSADVLPSGVEGVALPVHAISIASMGTPILDNLDLEAVSEACASRKRWEFLLTASPLAVDGGTGSPINPEAIF